MKFAGAGLSLLAEAAVSAEQTECSKAMLWQGRRESDNVEDVRRSGGGRIAGGGGIGGVILVVAYLRQGDTFAARDL